ncbi:GGDEF domain-containing protein [Anaerorhabdus sp.]|uniref:GGDEF domain-containing protein n=1 Tax=Anaerorhabdus sp. TaxID=1872524 RepID=UPI002FC6DFD7
MKIVKYHDSLQYEEYIQILENIGQYSVDVRRKTLSLLEEQATKDNDIFGLAVANFHYGILKSQIDDNIDESIEYAEKALDYAGRCDNDFFIMKINNLLGVNYSKKTDYSHSLHYYLQSYYHATRHPEYGYEYVVLNNIGNLFAYLDEYDTAATFVESAYEKYTKQEDKQRNDVAQLIINIVELYSCAHNYEKVDHWTQMRIISFTDVEQKALDCLALMNQIIINRDRASKEWLKRKIEKFIETSKDIGSEIYISRCLLMIFEVAIERTDEETTTKLEKELKAWRGHTQLTAFELNYYDNLVCYEMKYKHSIEIDETMQRYYQISKNTIRTMQNIYSTSLLLEIQLEEEKEIHRSALEEKRLLQKKIERDSFTNLYNKVYTEINISKELKKIIVDRKQALLVMDIDYFKKVNDTLGHDYGDIILLKVADILREVLDKSTIVGRYGGDEFVLFVRNFNEIDELKDIAQRLCNKVRKIEVDIDDMPNITLSIGIAVNQKDLNFNQLFKRADNALYECKKNGRNGFVLDED